MIMPIAIGDMDFAQAFDMLTQARYEITQDAEHKRGVEGQITCPKCKSGLLKYVISDNGHLQACCTTPDCLMFAE